MHVCVYLFSQQWLKGAFLPYQYLQLPAGTSDATHTQAPTSSYIIARFLIGEANEAIHGYGLMEKICQKIPFVCGYEKKFVTAVNIFFSLMLY